MRSFPNLKLYTASSWRNLIYPTVVDALRKAGHSVYDFRARSQKIFDLDQALSPEDYYEKLRSRDACRQFDADLAALIECDATVLVLPAGSSAHTEAGYVYGRNVPVIVYLRLHARIDAFVIQRLHRQHSRAAAGFAKREAARRCGYWRCLDRCRALHDPAHRKSHVAMIVARVSRSSGKASPGRVWVTVRCKCHEH
jgi:hypothetical protein